VADQERERLRDLSGRLLQLHSVLLDRERRAYEEAHGAVTARHLLQLLLGDERFAWLRSLSQMIARIDEALDEKEPGSPLPTARYFDEAQRLLRSGGPGEFETKYAEALQASPDVVMAHADVVRTMNRT
jgi:hypothetical protein